MTPSIPIKRGEDQDDGDQEQNLSCHGKHNTAGGFADGSEKVSGHRLQAVQEGTEHKNAEILLGKLIIKLAPEPKRLTICLGKIWKHINAVTARIVAVPAAHRYVFFTRE